MAERDADLSDRVPPADSDWGSVSGLTTLFDRHADAIHTYCFRRTASWQAAEDATATVFLEAWRGRVKLASGDVSPLPWLYGIANNVCRNATRSSHRRLRALGRAPSEVSAPDHADGVADRVDSERQMAAVLAEISKLPRHEQDVFALVVWSGLTYDQTATALGVPVGTIRSRLSRTRRRLASTLDHNRTDRPGSSEPDHA